MPAKTRGKRPDRANAERRVSPASLTFTADLPSEVRLDGVHLGTRPGRVDVDQVGDHGDHGRARWRRVADHPGNQTGQLVTGGGVADRADAGG